ncbi:hypothetical protein BX600DRAFT_321144 [Xylariales sp. PMI_506]|nr:hypothetical protein BX600DRAFT_321144 [Xylariales sp. PMI_506]
MHWVFSFPTLLHLPPSCLSGWIWVWLVHHIPFPPQSIYHQPLKLVFRLPRERLGRASLHSGLRSLGAELCAMLNCSELQFMDERTLAARSRIPRIRLDLPERDEPSSPQVDYNGGA